MPSRAVFAEVIAEIDNQSYGFSYIASPVLGLGHLGVVFIFIILNKLRNHSKWNENCKPTQNRYDTGGRAYAKNFGDDSVCGVCPGDFDPTAGAGQLLYDRRGH
jgi:hypothetical protein